MASVQCSAMYVHAIQKKPAQVLQRATGSTTFTGPPSSTLQADGHAMQPLRYNAAHYTPLLPYTYVTVLPATACPT